MKPSLVAVAALTCLVPLAPAAITAHPEAFVEAQPEANPPASATGPYAEGMRALNQQRWPDAVAAFARVASAHGRNADAALYWKAYSLNKLGKSTLANATCSQLHAAYVTSSWNRDCSALALTVQLAPGDLPSPAELEQLRAATTALSAAELKQLRQTTKGVPTTADAQALRAATKAIVAAETADLPNQPTDPSTDLKILALNSLMNRDPAQAIPILRNLLSSPQPSGVKQHALFVLAQNNAPEAQQLLREIVLGHTDPALQREAIQMLGVTEGKRANDTLDQLYRSTSDPQIKEAVLNAFFISGDAPRMVTLARQEKDIDRKRDIVSKLALMQDKAATDYMLELLK